MKKRANFLIKKYEYFNKRGKVTTEYYYIQELKRFLWWSYWKDIKHDGLEVNSHWKIKTKFDTIEEAQKFIREVLCPEIPRDTSRETTVDEMVCKNGESKW